MMRGLAIGLLVLGVADLVWINTQLAAEVWPSDGPANSPPSEGAALAQSNDMPVEDTSPKVASVARPAPTTPAPAAVPAAPPPAEPPPPPRRDPTLPQDGVVAFALGSDALDNTARSVLAGAVASLEADPRLRIELVGHADARGPTPANERLGLRRARAAKKYLVRSGIARSRITTASAGERQLLVTDDGEDAHRLNRRVEIEFSMKESR